MSYLILILILLVVFAGMVMGLRYFVQRNLADATAHLQTLNAEYTQRHEELKQRIQEAEQEYNERLARAKAEAEQLIAQARQESDVSKAQTLEEARLESERIVQQGLASRDGLRKELEQAMELRAIERARELLQQTLPSQLRQETQAHWVDELIQRGMAQLDQVKLNGEIETVQVVSAFPLSPEQRALLQQRLRQKAGRDVVVHESVDERLVAGLIITAGSVVLDGSLASKLQQAARDAKATQA